MEIRFINQSQEKRWNNYRKYLKPILLKTVERLSVEKEVALSVILTEDEEIHAINQTYRNIDRPTDVISFAMEEGESSGIDFDVRELGDIFINVNAVVRQSAEYGHSLKREFCFLFTHGLLHLLGYDHLDVDDEEKMFALQEEILLEIAKR